MRGTETTLRRNGVVNCFESPLEVSNCELSMNAPNCLVPVKHRRCTSGKVPGVVAIGLSVFVGAVKGRQSFLIRSSRFEVSQQFQSGGSVIGVVLRENFESFSR